MRVRVKADFLDLEAGVVREGGTSFEVTELRYAEIKAKLPNYVEEEAEKKAAPRKRVAKK